MGKPTTLATGHPWKSLEAIDGALEVPQSVAIAAGVLPLMMGIEHRLVALVAVLAFCELLLDGWVECLEFGGHNRSEIRFSDAA